MNDIAKVTKTFQIDYAHKLELDYESKCNNIHGHTGIIKVTIIGTIDPNTKMVVDYKNLKKIMQPIIDKLDHKFIISKKNIENNKQLLNVLSKDEICLLDINQSTSEEMAGVIVNFLKDTFKDVEVEFFETPNNSCKVRS